MGIYIKYQVCLSDFNKIGVFSTDFRKKILKTSSFMEIHRVGTELLHADRRTDATDRHDEASSRFSQFCELA